MIIDRILDRKDGEPYDAREFYNDMMLYGGNGIDIARAMDGGTNKDVQRELCKYIDDNDYNHRIKEYINKTRWIDD